MRSKSRSLRFWVVGYLSVMHIFYGNMLVWMSHNSGRCFLLSERSFLFQNQEHLSIKNRWFYLILRFHCTNTRHQLLYLLHFPLVMTNAHVSTMMLPIITNSSRGGDTSTSEANTSALRTGDFTLFCGSTVLILDINCCTYYTFHWWWQMLMLVPWCYL